VAEKIQVFINTFIEGMGGSVWSGCNQFGFGQIWKPRLMMLAFFL
jgi:hypothetical protein